MADPKKWTDDPYTNRARKQWFVARSIYKLEEIDTKFWLFGDDVRTVLDIWCAPWSWLQYAAQQINNEQWNMKNTPKIIGFDLKPVKINLQNTYTYQQDITDRAWVKSILDDHHIETFDVIMSDMAPDTIGTSDIDAIRSIWLIEKTLRLYEDYLADDGMFAIKVFMWPWFDELVRDMKEQWWTKHIRIFKPKACRKKSKETYIIKVESRKLKVGSWK